MLLECDPTSTALAKLDSVVCGEYADFLSGADVFWIIVDCMSS